MISAKARHVRDDIARDTEPARLAGLRVVKATCERVASSSDRLATWVRWLVGAGAGTVVALGLLVLMGWGLGNRFLTNVLPGHVSMKVNTALGFVSAGLALAAVLLGQTERDGRSRVAARRVATVLAGFTLACGATSVAEYVFGIDLHVDQALVFDGVTKVYPGRMAEITAINFCLAGMSLLLRRWKRGRRTARVLAVWLCVSAFAAIIAYLYGVEIFYGSINYTAMALHTGIGFLILGAGMVLVDADSTLVRVLCARECGGVVLRRALPGVIGLPVAMGWVYLWPAVNLGRPHFGMALYAVTLVCAGTVALVQAAQFLTRSERQREELARVREESSAAVRKSERELRLVTDHLPTLLSYIEPNGKFLRVNRTYERWLGRSASEIVGKHMNELLGIAFCERTEDERVRVLQGETVTFETTHPTVNGERHAQITYAPDMDELGEVRGIACMVLDVHERWEAESAARQSAKLEQTNKDLQKMAVTDQLTGLKNRGAFEGRMRGAFAYARRYGKELSVLMLDVDNFKVRNDTWGHAAGDEVLRKLGALLSAAVRVPDVAARYGGEEFTVLLQGSDLNCAAAVAERIRQVVTEQCWSGAAVTVSIGVSSLTDEMMDGEELVSAADEALYRAKRSGKDRVCCAM